MKILYKFKEIISFTLAAIFLLLILPLSGCGKTEDMYVEGSKVDAETFEADVPNLDETNSIMKLISQNIYPFPAGYTADFVARVDKTLMVVGHNDSETALALIDYDINNNSRLSFSEPTLLNINETVGGENSGILALCANKNAFLLLSDVGIISVLGIDGEVWEQYQISLSQLDGVSGMLSTDEGYILIYDMSKIIVYDPNRQPVNTLYGTNIENNMEICSLSYCSEGVILSGCIQSSLGLDPWYLLSQDCTSFKKIENTSVYMIRTYVPVQSLSGDFIYANGSTINKCNVSSGELTELFPWNYDAINPNMMCQLGENKFAVILSGSDSLFITGLERVPLREQSNVNVAIISKDEADKYYAEQVIGKANSSDGDYTYVPSYYNVDNINSLLVKMSGSDAPDLIISDGLINTNSDNFDDLFSYIDSSNIVSREDFIPNILESLAINGKLHEIWPRVQINTLALRTSDLTKEHMTVGDYNEVLAQNENYQALFDSFMTGNNLLKWIADISLGEYIDLQSSTCHFTDESFGNLLEWCSQMAPEYSGEQVGFSYSPSQIVLSFEIISIPGRVYNIRENMGEPVTFVGFPSNNGYGNFFAKVGNSFAIPKNSGNKAGAWALVESQLSAENQNIDNGFNGLPVVFKSLKRLAESQLSDKTDLSAFYDLINNTTKAITENNEEIRNIIISDGQKYLSGSCSLADAVNSVQSKVSIYLAEHSA